MRILTAGNMYPPHHLGGYELTWRSSVEHLRGAGHEVTVLTTDFAVADPDPGLAEGPDVIRDLRWYWRDHEFPSMSARERVALERHNADVLDRAIAAARPEVVCWWAMGGMSLSLIERVRRAGIPAIGVVGDDWMHYGPVVDKWLRMTRRMRGAGTLLGRAVGVPTRVDLRGITWLFNSDAMRAAAGDLALERAEVAHPGIDHELFSPAPEKDWRWRLLHVGRLDERKGIETAIEALPRLPGEATLTVLGSGDEHYLRLLRERAEGLGLGDRVHFGHRPRTDLPAAYADADVLLFPVTWDEPWGLVPLEAMAVGTPVVATGTGGSAEYLEHRGNALVIGRAGTAADLAEAVRTLAGDAELRSRLRDGGRATAARYTERGYDEAIAAALSRAAQPVSRRPPPGGS